jgi:YVTN family beta-propeller protein
MNILSTILDRLNQRIEVGNIFDQIYGLSELVGEGNDKAWAHYIGNGQAIPVTNFDAKQGTLFWAKRGKITVNKNETLRLAGCRSIYETRFTLTAYAMVRKSHLPCDSADAQDWVASRVLRLISGTDPQFKTAIGAIAYEVVPSGYATEARYLPVNYEWAAVAIDVDVNVSTSSEDGCYDTCQTGDIPLPDFEPCEPCLTSVAVDGVTITGNGTPADPLVAIGGGTPLRTQDEGVNVSTNTTTLNFTGDGVTASLTSPGVVQVNIPSGGGVTSVSGVAPIASSGGNTPAISIPQATASVDGYLDSADFATFAGKQDALTAGTGISLASNIVTNTAPDQIVSLTGGTGISTSGTYPSFTIDNTAPDQIVSITGGTDISVSGTYPNFTIDSTAATGMQGGQATGTDTYAVSIPGVTAYNLNDAYAIGFTNANTGASTLNINGLGAVNIAKNNVVPIIGGDIAANQQFIAIYDGTNFQLLGVAPNQMFAYITNADSVTINRGQPVYAFGATGDRMTVKLANNTSEATSSKTVGLVFSNSIGPNQKGYIITQGVIDGINTNAYAAGDTLYVGNTAGALTNVLPLAPNHLTRIGIVERANAGNGQIYVFVQNGFQLDELSDVDITTTPLANNQFLVYTTGVNNLWKNRTLGNVLGGTTSQYVRGDGSLATLPSATSTPYIEGELIGNAISQNSNCLDILVEPSINRLYVPFFGGNVTYIFNTSTNALVATLSTTGVNAVFYIASVNQLWVTYLANGNISRFNATTGASAGADITGSGNRGQHYIEYSATKVFIANSGSNSVTVVNPATATVTATIATTAAFPRSMVLNTNVASAQNDRIAVVCANGNAMLLINPNTNAITIAAVNVGSQMSTPNSIVYDATSDRYIIGNIGNNRLLYITPTTATSFTYDTYTDAFRPYELNYNSSTRYVYITQPTPANSVFNPTSLAVVDAATKQMIKQIVTSSFDATNIGLSVITIDTTNGYIYLVSYGASARIIKIKI